MEYFSESYFRNFNFLYEQRSFCERDRNASPNAVFDIFLSYNINDYDVVKGIYYKLSKMDYRVYLDNIVDPDLKTKKTDKETAAIIHNRLLHSKSLIYAHSANANQSNWMPWELGVADGRGCKCMIMPVALSDNSVPKKREYLFLYPYLMKGSLDTIQIESDDKFISGQLLKNYLKYSR